MIEEFNLLIGFGLGVFITALYYELVKFHDLKSSQNNTEAEK